MKWAALVPELAVSDFAASLAFYTQTLGFKLEYERIGFAYVSFGEAAMMIEQAGDHWTTDVLEPPFGRGVNFQIEVDDVDALLLRLSDIGWPLFKPRQTHWYKAGYIERGQAEFLIQDPDGYLLRFCQILGNRPIEP